jgi:hypothetical protein
LGTANSCDCCRNQQSHLDFRRITLLQTIIINIIKGHYPKENSIRNQPTEIISKLVFLQVTNAEVININENTWMKDGRLLPISVKIFGGDLRKVCSSNIEEAKKISIIWRSIAKIEKYT